MQWVMCGFESEVAMSGSGISETMPMIGEKEKYWPTAGIVGILAIIVAISAVSSPCINIANIKKIRKLLRRQD